MLLENNRLAIKVEEPHVFPDTTSRFDHAGFISSVVLDKKYEFCTSEPTNLVHPSTGGIGLCNEYLFPIACEETKAGERFAKFGIGLFLKPDDQPYCFFRKYDTEFFPVVWEQENAQTIVFKTEPILSNGYAVSQVKKLKIDENTLTMEVSLRNEGIRAIQMKEFCHNFVTIERKPLGKAYTLEIPALKDRGQGAVVGTVKGNGHGYSFSAYNPKAALVNVTADEIDDVESFTWVLRNSESKAAIHAEVDFKPDGIDMWSIDHIISIETFRPIDLAPGESTTWVRKWTFTDENDE